MCMSLYRIELILEKNCLLIFWVPLFLRTKAVTDVKNSLYYGQAYIYGFNETNFFLRILTVPIEVV